ncbi:cyclohexanone 1,2-monooxygenase [Rhizodiscina lignyota]|uniref:Cyclohexanone 1,2-monooxygenase n=1 Tax=Rhizodiscina lignyota TaxID=1504668 RepID=A0A9P4I5A6_9PEZI|nr:cyclohexanone 1,2-monooxygenase [Rhizodiscina lignyota]
MATADVAQPQLPEALIPQPERTKLDAPIETVTNSEKLAFDPVKLKEKYREERNKRLRGDGVDQYIPVDGSLSHYLDDPWVEPGFTRDPIDEEVDVVIIGGGYGAQLVAAKLIEAGVKDIRLIEKAGSFGGTWYWNRYPGAQCDIESYIYMPLLEELGYMPTEKYARANELLRHSEMIGKHFDLHRRTLFQTEVKSLHWDEESARWTAKTSRGDLIHARFVVPASGPLHRPKMPGVPGIESFKGHSFHSSRFDFNYTGGDSTGGLTKLKDKRVGIIGTGATAVQIVPHLGEWAKQLYVFQRTPSSIDVRGNRPTDPEWAASLTPGWQKRRMDNFNIIVNGGQQDEDLVSDGWTDILRRLMNRPRNGVPVDPQKAQARRQLADFEKMESVRARADSIVENKDIAESLKPYYNQFCKRPCFHDEYLQTFNRPNVRLVDTKGQGITAITEKGVVANGEEFELDCLIYATGFELATDWSHRTGIEIYGRDGLTITEHWKGGARTLHGWTSRGFPNCYFVQIVQAALTPNFIHVTQIQAEHIAWVISQCAAKGIRTTEPTEKAEQEWIDTIIKLGEMRREFHKECTPGYYNDEGRPNPKRAQSASYGGGSPAFLKILEEWREKGDMEGLDLTYLKADSPMQAE